ncbi:MAG TPA: single-stranded DNA-binding protein [Nocardioidaceae bacterium]|nr:single-stranded DNA-binding protein [Nocardioidaceae bacterium]
MQHDAQVTISGYVGTNVEFRPGGTNGADRAMFRLATTPRFLDRRQGVWREQETVWMTVKAWRTLAQNAASSIRRGEPVVVIGRLRTERWDGDDGHERRRDVLEATMVAHDLSRGTSAFQRNDRTPERADSTPEAPAYTQGTEVSGTNPADQGDERIPAAV